MKCEFCKKKLVPYMLKQVDYRNGVQIFEIECIKCRKYNYVSEQSYLNIKKGWHFPQVQPINNKFPCDMNVIFVSMERCGISWIVRELNKQHRDMFGKDLVFHPEISPVKATRTRFPITDKGIMNSDDSLYLKGWYNVYDVNPLDLLKKEYDRIVIIKRKKNILLKVLKIYYPPDLSNEQRKRFNEKNKEIYSLIYEQEINDPRCITFDLDDFNNYTVASFKELMDFLNFPEKGRSHILPIAPPERVFEIYSSILNKNQPLCNRLQIMAKTFEITKEGFLKQIINLKKNKNEYESDFFPLNNILIIGPKIDKGCHLSENLYYAFKEKEYYTRLLPLEELGWGTPLGKKYMSSKEAYPLSKAIEKSNMVPDLIIFDEPAFFFYNDVRIPVFYIQREFKRPPTVYFPDVAFFWHRGILNYFKNIFAPYWSNNIKLLKVLDIAVDPKRYKPMKKTIKGIVFLAGREPMNSCINMKELTALGCLYKGIEEMQEVSSYIQYIEDEDGGLTDERFRELLTKTEAIWIYIPAGQYISRRIIEAMACKTVGVMKLENEEHEKILEEMGFYANKHYIKLEKLSDLKDLQENWDYDNYKDMVEDAYDIVMKNHLFSNRVEQLVDIYKQCSLGKRGFFIQ